MRGKGEWRATDSNTTMALIDGHSTPSTYVLTPQYARYDIEWIMGSNTRHHHEGEERRLQGDHQRVRHHDEYGMDTPTHTERRGHSHKERQREHRVESNHRIDVIELIIPDSSSPPPSH